MPLRVLTGCVGVVKTYEASMGYPYGIYRSIRHANVGKRCDRGVHTVA